MFENTINLLNEYYRKLDVENPPNFNRDLSNEVRERLQQLNFIITNVRNKHDRLKTINGRPLETLKKHVDRIQAEGLDFETTPAPEGLNFTREEFQEMHTLPAQQSRQSDGSDDHRALRTFQI
jgi:hypothetical protein